MSQAPISLGFAEGHFPPGAHICQVYSDDGERDRAQALFVAAGLKLAERCACFSDHTDRQGLARELAGQGLAADAAQSSGQLTIATTHAAYFSAGRFEPERMLQQVREFYGEARRDGYPGARIIGEMTNEIERVPGGSRLLEYEARVTALLREHPLTAVCQYDARAFDGASIMDVLRIHPYIVIGGAVVQNPFFTPPPESFRRGPDTTA